MILTATMQTGYSFTTAAHSAVGTRSPFRQGAEVMRRKAHGFFYALSVMVGARGSRKACRNLVPVCEPVASASICFAASGGGLTTTDKGAIMAKSSKSTGLIPFAQRFVAGVSTRTVSGRELHKFLDSKRDFSNWIKSRIEQYDFEPNKDYIVCSPKLASKKRGGHNSTEYYLTLDMAKELAMVERNAKGKQARQYFIDCEKQLKAQYGQKRIEPSALGARRYITDVKADGTVHSYEVPSDAFVVPPANVEQVLAWYRPGFMLVKRSYLEKIEALCKQIREVKE